MYIHVRIWAHTHVHVPVCICSCMLLVTCMLDKQICTFMYIHVRTYFQMWFIPACIMHNIINVHVQLFVTILAPLILLRTSVKRKLLSQAQREIM